GHAADFLMRRDVRNGRSATDSLDTDRLSKGLGNDRSGDDDSAFLAKLSLGAPRTLDAHRLRNSARAFRTLLRGLAARRGRTAAGSAADARQPLENAHSRGRRVATVGRSEKCDGRQTAPRT